MELRVEGRSIAGQELHRPMQQMQWKQCHDYNSAIIVTVRMAKTYHEENRMIQMV
jgi:hypothetical protein